MEEITLSRLTLADRPTAVSILTLAFITDPLMACVLEDQITSEAKNKALTAIMDYSLAIREQLNWPILGLWSGGDLAGVAALSLPYAGAWPDSLTVQYQALRDLLGHKGTHQLETYGEISERARPKQTHIFLGVLGVDPKAQGRGYGRRILDAVQDYSDASPGSIGVFLDTANPIYVAFYERCGFVRLEHFQVEEVGMWCLYRPGETGLT